MPKWPANDSMESEFSPGDDPALPLCWFKPPKVEELLKELGIGLSSKKLKKAMAQLDPGGEGIVWKDDFLTWYAENGHG